MALDLKGMEREILDAVLAGGKLGSFESNHSGRWQSLYDKYPSAKEQEQVKVLIDDLVEKRYLSHLPGATPGDGNKIYIRGITPDGLQRLKELKAPRWTWFKSNWFPTLVAGITAIAAVGSIVVDATCNRG